MKSTSICEAMMNKTSLVVSLYLAVLFFLAWLKLTLAHCVKKDGTHTFIQTAIVAQYSSLSILLGPLFADIEMRQHAMCTSTIGRAANGLCCQNNMYVPVLTDKILIFSSECQPQRGS